MFSFQANPKAEAGVILVPSPLIWCLRVSVCITYKGEVWRVLAQQSGEDSLSLDALLVLKHVAIHKAIQHSGVGMNINVELQTDSLMEEKRKRTEGQGNRQMIKNIRLARILFCQWATLHIRDSPLGVRKVLSRLWGYFAGERLSPMGWQQNPPDTENTLIPERSQPPTHNFHQAVLLKGTVSVRTWSGEPRAISWKYTNTLRWTSQIHHVHQMYLSG